MESRIREVKASFQEFMDETKQFLPNASDNTKYLMKINNNNEDNNNK